MPSSRFAHLSKLCSTLSKYGFEGCGVLTAGFEGLRAALVGGTESVEHPAISSPNTSSAIKVIGRTGSGKPASIVSTALARSFQTQRLRVRTGDSRGVFQSFEFPAIVAPLEV